MIKKLRSSYAKRFLPIEFLLAGLMAALFVLWAERLGGWTHIDNVLHGNRAAVYGALASVFGALFGFVIAAVAIVLGYADSPRLEVLRESRSYADLWEIFVSSMRALGIATIASLMALILDRDADVARLPLYFLVFASLWAAARVLRVLWAIENIIRITTRPLRPDGTALVE